MSFRKSLILVVDDDPQITSFLKRYLEKQEFRVACAPDWREMENVLANENVDLCILDIGLPGKSGLEITRDLRSKSSIPILVLSGRDEAFDRVVGLEFGADDYMVKPYEPRELLARIRTILRRCSTDVVEQADAGVAYKFGEWVVNLSERSLTNANTQQSCEITTTEFEILHTFLAHPGQVFSRNQLLDVARGRESFSGDRSVDVHIVRLRKKLETGGSNIKVYIKTIHGVGYSFVVPVQKTKT